MLKYKNRMEDKKLEARKRFLDPVRWRKEEREKFMVELRKKNKSKLFQAKRLRRAKEQKEKDNEGEPVVNPQTL